MLGRRAPAAVPVAVEDPPRVHGIAQGGADAVAHVKAVRRGWEAFNRRDFDGAVQYLHPDGEAFPAAGLRDPRGVGNAGRLRGREEVRRYLEKVGNAWQRVTVEPREVTLSPAGRLLVVEDWRIHDRDGIQLETMTITVYAFRDGLVARLDGFLDRATALEALGSPN
jgi:ketosteroid isomerase-like protein